MKGSNSCAGGQAARPLLCPLLMVPGPEDLLESDHFSNLPWEIKPRWPLWAYLSFVLGLVLKPMSNSLKKFVVFIFLKYDIL